MTAAYRAMEDRLQDFYARITLLIAADDAWSHLGKLE
jgi:hypothetical protein